MEVKGTPVHARYCRRGRCLRLCLHRSPFARRIFLEEIEHVLYILPDLDREHATLSTDTSLTHAPRQSGHIITSHESYHGT